jgi:hypothetical protein
MRLSRGTNKYEKLKVVLFSSNYARILVNPKDHNRYKKAAFAAYSPSLASVSSVPMQYWKKRGNSVIPMTKHEMKMRDIDIDFNGIDRDFDPMRTKQLHERTSFVGVIAMTYIIATILGGLYYLSSYKEEIIRFVSQHING